MQEPNFNDPKEYRMHGVTFEFVPETTNKSKQLIIHIHRRRVLLYGFFIGASTCYLPRFLLEARNSSKDMIGTIFLITGLALAVRKAIRSSRSIVGRVYYKNTVVFKEIGI
jgi:hypothetical protein